MCNMSRKSRFEYIGEKRRAYAKSGKISGAKPWENFIFYGWIVDYLQIEWKWEYVAMA